MNAFSSDFALIVPLCLDFSSILKVVFVKYYVPLDGPTFHQDGILKMFPGMILGNLCISHVTREHTPRFENLKRAGEVSLDVSIIYEVA